MTAEVVSVEATPAEAWVAEDIPGHDTWVTVEVRLSAKEDTPVADGLRASLLYGANLTRANGWASDQETPTRITPDSPVTLMKEFSLPWAGLDELRLTVALDNSSPEWTFTEVETLLN